MVACRLGVRERLTDFVYERARGCYRQRDGETWIRLWATGLTYCQLAWYGPNCAPQLIHGTFWHVL